MKKIVILMGVVLLSGTVGVPPARADQALEQYNAGMALAYKYYWSGDYVSALKYYDQGARTAVGKLHDDYVLDAQVGVQNSLVKLNRFRKAASFGDKLLMKYPKNVYVLINTAYAYLALGKYKNAIKHYTTIYELDHRNQAAMEGLAWSYNGLGDLEHAKKYAELALIANPGNTSLKQLNTAYTSAKYSYYELSGYYTWLGYGSTLKKEGNARDVAFTLVHNTRHRFDFAYEGLTIDFLSVFAAPLQEDSYTGSYTYSGNSSTTLTYKKIRTNDTSLGEGDVGTLGYAWKKLLLSGSCSKYMASRASEGGIGLNTNLGPVSLSVVGNGIARDDIINNGAATIPTDDSRPKNISVYKNYWIGTLAGNYYTEHLHFGLSTILGTHSMHVADSGFSVNDAPDEVNSSFKGMLEYNDKIWSLGYTLGYSEGLNLTNNKQYSSVAHTIKLLVRWW